MADPLRPGRMYTREQVREHFGGALQGGIVPSRRGRTVLLYSDRSVAEDYGYEDGWVHEQLYLYTGTGQSGDQSTRGANGSILHHRERGFDVLRLFVAYDKPRGPQVFRYVGRFRVDETEPCFFRRGEGKDGRPRDAVVFRLRPEGPVSVRSVDYVTPMAETTVTTWHPGPLPDEPEAPLEEKAVGRRIPTEKHTGEPFHRKAVEALEGHRREAELAARFEASLRSLGHTVTRFEIMLEGRRSPLRTDLYDSTDGVLYEAKASSSRDSIRLAIGQLFDYRRHIRPEPARLAILLPEAPEKDLRELIASVGIALVYEDGEDFIGWPVEPSLTWSWAGCGRPDAADPSGGRRRRPSRPADRGPRCGWSRPW